MRSFVPLCGVILAMTATSAHAGPISWNTWTSNSTGSLTVQSTAITVNFATTNFHSAIANYPSWSPASTFADGTIVNNGPIAANGIMQLVGGTSALNTLTFSMPITDPVIAIWSLGTPGIQASFVFDATPTFIAGGPNAEYGGSAISVAGNVVSGLEGNGVVQFYGSFTSISWTNPQYESWYGFNVGVAGVAAVPEPASVVLMLSGAACLPFLRRWSTTRG